VLSQVYDYVAKLEWIYTGELKPNHDFAPPGLFPSVIMIP